MALPKRKVSRARRDKRRTHKKLSIPAYAICPQCREVMLSHHVCLSCGSYKGRRVLPVEEV